MDLVSQLTTFASGILLARWQMNREQDAPEREVPGSTAWIVLTCACLYFVGLVYATPWVQRSGLNFSYLLTPAFAAIIWIFAQTEILPVRLMKAKWLVVLGEASYGLYLLQNPVGHFLRWMRLPDAPMSYPVYLGACIGLSVLSFYFFETPARRWILHRFHARTRETMEAASAAQ
jgi:peptidoglycan/LPS O-acetylase OafA/YrhL